MWAVTRSLSLCLVVLKVPEYMAFLTHASDLSTADPQIEHLGSGSKRKKKHKLKLVGFHAII